MLRPEWPAELLLRGRARHLIGPRGVGLGLSQGNGENGTGCRVRQAPRGAAALELARRAAAVIADRQDVGAALPRLRYHAIYNVSPPDCQGSVGEAILTIKGHSKPVVLSGQYRGIAKDREGHERIAFEATGAVDRRDFGISWNESIAGAELIGNNVEITIGIEAVRVD